MALDDSFADLKLDEIGVEGFPDNANRGDPLMSPLSSAR